MAACVRDMFQIRKLGGYILDLYLATESQNDERSVMAVKQMSLN